MGITQKAERAAVTAAVEGVLRYVKKDPDNALLNLVDVSEKIAGNMFSQSSYDTVRKMLQDKDNKWNLYVKRLLRELHPNVIKMTALNLGYQAAYRGTKTIRQLREEYQCNIPWLILMDPTSACNLHCIGCWAAEYGHNLNLTFEEMDKIVTEGKKLGIYFYMFTGGEPLVRKADLIRLCDKHRECAFHSFTNGTLIDEEFALELERVGNLSFSLSIEGFEADTDHRRGEGVYQKVLHAMDILKAHGQLFGFSICYTSLNTNVVATDEFLDLMIEKGCRFGWYFTYMPVGVEAQKDLIATPEQREYMYHRIREVRAMEGGKPIFLMDFQNDGEYVGGCIAGGRNYMHINANGDVEPCVFIHYSSANIRTHSLLDALRQPIFMAYHENQPFNNNHLRPCPMLENPEMLKKMVKETGAKSTDLQAPESVDDLCAKCKEFSEAWAPKADELWENNKHFVPKYNYYAKKTEEVHK